MQIYIDDDFRCHAKSGSGLRAVESPFFDGKCDEFINGYRFIPADESWTMPDGTSIHGPSVFPAESFDLLQRFQTQHEADMAASADMAEALAILGVTE